jgi:hypothetical protein
LLRLTASVVDSPQPSAETDRMQPPTPTQPNTLGNAGLGLGVASSALVFGLGLCALVGAQQGWLAAAGTILFICGASSAFLGLLGAIISVGGLFGANRSRATAVVGLILSLLGLCLFVAILGQFSAG